MYVTRSTLCTLDVTHIAMFIVINYSSTAEVTC